MNDEQHLAYLSLQTCGSGMDHIYAVGVSDSRIAAYAVVNSILATQFMDAMLDGMSDEELEQVMKRARNLARGKKRQDEVVQIITGRRRA